MAKPLTGENLLKLREQADREYARLKALYDDQLTADEVNAFNNTFSICESVYKVILYAHQKKLHKNKAIDRKWLKITMSQVPAALRFAGYAFDNELLDRVFGSNEKRGQKSAKKLRDELTHHLNPAAVNELKARKKELYADMETFLNAFHGSGK